jgi:hypothetical protein
VITFHYTGIFIISDKSRDKTRAFRMLGQYANHLYSKIRSSVPVVATDNLFLQKAYEGFFLHTSCKISQHH